MQAIIGRQWWIALLSGVPLLGLFENSSRFAWVLAVHANVAALLRVGVVTFVYLN